MMMMMMITNKQPENTYLSYAPDINVQSIEYEGNKNQLMTKKKKTSPLKQVEQC